MGLRIKGMYFSGITCVIKRLYPYHLKLGILRNSQEFLWKILEFSRGSPRIYKEVSATFGKDYKENPKIFFGKSQDLIRNYSEPFGKVDQTQYSISDELISAKICFSIWDSLIQWQYNIYLLNVLDIKQERFPKIVAFIDLITKWYIMPEKACMSKIKHYFNKDYLCEPRYVSVHHDWQHIKSLDPQQ